MLEPTFVLMNIVKAITDGIFETGAYKVLSKSQNPTVLGQSGPSSNQCNVQTLAGKAVGAINLAPTSTLHFDTALKTKYLVLNWIFYFLLK